MYGKELILDLHECDPGTFSRESLVDFFTTVCDEIDMEMEDRHFWDDPEGVETEPHIVGTSAIQFIRTSNITIHCLDLLQKVYLNIFSCKEFDPHTVEELASQWFKGTVANRMEVSRV
jgi:S-adenosylmethionine/arginine decarboxylase-like enzyme